MSIARRLLAVAAIAATSGCDGAGNRDDQAIRTEVEAALRDWSSTGAEGRWDDLKALYADDPGFIWIEQGRIAYASHAAVVEGVEAAKSSNAQVTSSIRDIVVTPLAQDVAAYHAHAAFTVAAEQFPFSFDGAFSGVAIKRGGEWRLLQGHLSAPQAPATEALSS